MAERGLIYVLIDPRDGRVRYCGKTVKEPQDRLKEHIWTRPKARHRPLYRWFDEVLDLRLCPQIAVVEVVAFEDLDRTAQIVVIDEAERRWITNLREAGAELLNLTDGGNGAHGRVMTPEHKERIGQANRGRPRTLETKRKLSAVAKARGEKQYRAGMESPGWGDQSRVDQSAKAAKIREAWASKTIEARKAHGACHRGSANVRAKINAATALAIFEATGSQREIARCFGVHWTLVWSVKHGKTWSHVTGA